MQVRMNYRTANPEVFDTMMGLEMFVRSRGIDKTLYELLKIRASQLNGCSFCIDMHATELQQMGESFDRILLLTAWREVPIYTDAEKAVLDLTEHLTRLPESGVPQHVYDAVRAHFDEKQFVDLVMAINVINCWNRLGVSTGMFPGCLL